MINDTTRPLILLGSNSNIYKLLDLTKRLGITVAGIIDDDYAGQGEYKGIPVIGREQDIIDNRTAWQEQYQFICATNWVADDYEIAERNRRKRHRQLDLLDGLGMPVATLVAPFAVVASTAKLGHGVIVWDFATIEPEVVVQDFVQIYDYAVIGHETEIGRNTTVQRYCLVTSLVQVSNDVYLGLRSAVSRSGARIAQHTFVHPELMLLRHTEPWEVVSIANKDLRKVYLRPVERE